MIRNFILLPLLSTLTWAVPSFQFSPVTDYPTAYSTRIYWSSNASATATVKYGLTSSYGTTTDLGSGAGGGKLWVWNITGLLPSTTYHYSVCLNDGAETCSDDATFATLSHGSVVPTSPATVDTTMPANAGTVRTVASDCSDFASIYAASTWGDIIEIPPTATCTSTYALAGKTHNPGDGWIIIRPTTYASLPAAGTRIGESDEANMFKLVHTGPGVADYRSATAIVDQPCTDASGYLQIDWNHNGTTGWPLIQCQPSATTKSITAATVTCYPSSGQCDEGRATLTITGHGLVVDQTVWISGATSTSGAVATVLNGGAKVISVTDADTVVVRPYRHSVAATTDTYTGSGVMAPNVYVAVTHSSGAGAPTGACTDGAWYYNTTTAVDETTRAKSIYYCGADSVWHGPFDNQKQQEPLLDLRTAKYIRIIGGLFTHLPPMTDPLLNRSGAHHAHVNRYTSMEAFVVESYQTSHVILDRCWIKGYDQARVNLAMNMHGDNVAFINSRISEWSWWVGTADPDLWVDTEAGGIYPQTGPGPGLIHNSYMEVGGITIHFDDSYAHNAPAANNYTISANTFYRPPKWFYGHASSNGRMYFHRHLLEWKVGNTVRAVGNIFDGNWRTLNRGEAIILGFRSGGWYGTCTWTSGTASCGKAHFLAVDDLVTLDESSIRTVTAVSDSTHFTLSGSVSDGNHATNKLNHDTSISDIAMESNLIRNVPNVFAIFGVQDNRNMKGRATARVSFKNNLAYNINQDYGTFAGAGEGSMALIYWGVEDATVEHNTFICATGGTCREPIVSGINPVGSATTKGTGLAVQNNLAHGGDYSCFISDSTGGTSGLNLSWNDWTYSSNVLFRAGGDPGSCPSGNKWHNVTTLGAIPLDGDYRLTSLYRAADTCYSVAGDCTTDATDSGVDIDVLNAALAGGGPAPPVITTASPLPAGTIGVPYSVTLGASSGTAPYVWDVSAGTLPAGLTLSSGGVLSGIPTATGAASFTLHVVDATPLASALDATLTIGASRVTSSVRGGVQVRGGVLR